MRTIHFAFVGLFPMMLALGSLAGLVQASTAADSAAVAQRGDGSAAQVPTAADYAAAARVLGFNLQGLVRNESVEPHWLGDSGRFWYRRDGEEGPQFVLVTEKGSKSPAFDHTGLTRALFEVLGEQPSNKVVLSSLAEVRISDDLTSLSGRAGQRSVDCNLQDLKCRAFDAPTSTPELLRSPDGRQAVLARDNNLFVREMATGEERQLTSDGAPYYSWGKMPDDLFGTVARQKSGMKQAPFQTYWSPDGRFLIALRLDERKVAPYPFVEWVPTDGTRRPIVYESRLSFTGDRGAMVPEYFIFDLQSGRRTQIGLPEGYKPSLLFDDVVLGWSRKRGQAFVMTRTSGSKSTALYRVNLADGRATKVIENSWSTRAATNTVEYNIPNIRILGDGDEIVWYSDRSGWGHLYLYDAQSGRLKNAITHGQWLVHDIHAVDESRREIYFTAGGREPGRDPYYRHLYRAGLDGRADVKLLTEPNADHHFDPQMIPVLRPSMQAAMAPLIQPAAGVFVDTWSTVDHPPVSVLRSARDGRLIAELERADASRLFATGWKPPVRERIKAADGTTDLYAVYYAPQGKRADGAKHPVIDAAYGGPQVSITPRNFPEAYGTFWGGTQNALTHLGFGVVTVDGRGTPVRSRAFRDAGYTEFTQLGIDDHIAAIRALAGRYPRIDLRRVGIYGGSWGGTFAAQAILSRPEFYKVAVSTAGVYDYAAMYAAQFDNMIGPPVYADGTPYRGNPAESPVNWSKLDITRLADRLQGHLMLVYGDMDENVPSHQAFRLIDALTRANKPYDLLYMPNRTHASAIGDPYVVKRTWDYFVEHLRGAQPVFDFKIEARPPDVR